jgi:hypothetical protein
MDNRCTLFINGNWIACCVGHDYDYADGGSYREKVKADLRLWRCVWKKGHPVIGFIMFLGVSTGGLLCWRWRWLGYSIIDFLLSS